MGNNLYNSTIDKHEIFDQVVNSNGELNLAKFNVLFENILYSYGVSFAQEFVHFVKSRPDSHKLDRRIKIAEKQINELIQYFNTTENFSDRYLVVKNSNFEEFKVFKINNLMDIDLSKSEKFLISNREDCFIFKNNIVNQDNYSLLKKKGFEKTSLRSNNDVAVRILNDTRLSGSDSNFYAVIDGNSYYDRKNCARLAKLTNVNFIAKSQKEKIKEAIILPIAHTDKNYFHHLTEMWYGLNYIKYFNQDLPIIYTEDTFELLDFFCEKLKLDKSRFKSFKQMENTIVEKAYHFSPMAYLWDESFFEFFKSLNAYSKPNFKIFIANPKGASELKNKEEVFVLLRKNGFLIVHPQDLNMKKMIDLFQKASIVLCQSNVILTNTAFMKSGTHLIEILDEKNISPEFYYRTRFNKMGYSCLVPNSGVVDINELEKIIAKHLYLETKGALNHE